VPSSASAVYGGRWLRSDAVEPLATGRSVGVGLQMILNGVAAQRSHGELPESQFADLHYLDLLRDPITTMRAAYERLGLPFGDDLPARFRAYLDARPQHKHGVHRYRPEDFGMDAADLRTRFAPYTDRYGVEPEDA
jgi:hypothetical protein